MVAKLQEEIAHSTVSIALTEGKENNSNPLFVGCGQPASGQVPWCDLECWGILRATTIESMRAARVKPAALGNTRSTWNLSLQRGARSTAPIGMDAGYRFLKGHSIRMPWPEGDVVGAADLHDPPEIHDGNPISY
jgi:hypothetical protein